MRILKRVACLLPLLLIMAACSGSSNQEIASQLQIEEFQYVRNQDGERVLRGTLYNPTAQAVNNVQVQVSLLDQNNRRIDTANIPISKVAAGERKPFRQVLDVAEDVRSAKVHQISVL